MRELTNKNNQVDFLGEGGEIKTMYEIKVCKKLINASGKSFTKLIAVIENTDKDAENQVVFKDFNMSNNCKSKLEKNMIKQDIEYPILLTLADGDYFITSEEKNGYVNEKIVAMDYQSFKKAPKYENPNKPQTKTIADLFK